MPESEKKKAKNITEPMRSALLRRPFEPSVTRDRDVPGLALHVTKRRGFWALTYQPRGLNPRTGSRWGGGVRHELGDAMLMTADEARTAAMMAKALVRQGRSPHHEAMASRAAVEAARAVVPQTVAETIALYETALMARRRPSEWTRKQSVRYARLACALMNANALPLAAIDVRMVRLLVETASGSDAQRMHIYGGLNRFLTWCRKQALVETNPCDALDRHDRPKPGKARDHVPSLATLRAVWAAAADEPACDLLRFLLLVPLRRNEASGLRWSEVDFDRGRIRIAASRMKAGELHELPLAPPARAILEARAPKGALVFPSSKGKPFANWAGLLARVRRKIGESQVARAERFSLHDTRRAFVSHLADEFDVDALDQVLAHKRSGVAAIYQRSNRWPARVEALDLWAKYILGEAEPSEAKPGNKVVPFARRANA
jgi:integrase